MGVRDAGVRDDLYGFSRGWGMTINDLSSKMTNSGVGRGVGGGGEEGIP